MDPWDAACGAECQVVACSVGTGIVIGSVLWEYSTSTYCVVGAMEGSKRLWVGLTRAILPVNSSCPCGNNDCTVVSCGL